MSQTGDAYGPVSWDRPTDRLSAGYDGDRRPLVPNADVVRSIAGRAIDSREIRRDLVALVPLVLFVPAYLLIWASAWSSRDHAVGVQIGFGITLAVVGLALLARTARIGTDVTWTGIRYHYFVGYEDYPWTAVQGFTPQWRGRSGVWAVVPRSTGVGADIGVMVPSPLHRWDPEAASAVVDRLNATLETRPPVSERRGPTAFERLCAWTWFLPLVTFGLGSVPVLIAVACTGRRLWVWIVTAGVFDATAVFWSAINGTGVAQVVAAVSFVGIWLGSSAALLVGWLGTRRGRRRHLPG